MLEDVSDMTVRPHLRNDARLRNGSDLDTSATTPTPPTVAAATATHVHHMSVTSSSGACMSSPAVSSMLLDQCTGATSSSSSSSSLLRSREFVAYLVCAVSIIGYGLLLVAHASRAHVAALRPLLRRSRPWVQAWLHLPYEDSATDVQWRGYSANVWQLIAVNAALAVATYNMRRVVCFALARQLARRERRHHHSTVNAASSSSNSNSSKSNSNNTSASSHASASSSTPPAQRGRVRRATQRLLACLHAGAALVFLAVVHGPLLVVPLLLTLVYYLAITALRRRTSSYALYMTFVWLYNIVVLYASVRCHGFEEVVWLRSLVALPWTLWRGRGGATAAGNGAVTQLRELVRATPHATTTTAATMTTTAEAVMITAAPPTPTSPLAPLPWRRRVRWHMMQGMTLLRMIAYACDMWDAHQTQRVSAARERALAKHRRTCLDCAMLRSRWCSSGSSKQDDRCGSNGSSNNTSCSVSASSPLRTHGEGDVAGCYIGSCSNNNGSHNGSHNSLVDEHNGGEDESMWCYKLRTEYARAPAEYNVVNYYAYLYFIPLYMTGPVSSYNAFVSYLAVAYNGGRATHSRALVRYACRIVGLYLCLWALLHVIYVNAILARPSVLFALTTATRASVLFYTLAFLWLKFSVIWKLSRLCSLCCGVDVPEDMRRCFANVSSVQGFWRDWHASFNLWIVRYMYIPMGGSKRKHLSIFPIFIFIAAWHDLDLRLLYWATCICVAFVIELAVTAAVRRVRAAVYAEMCSIEAATPTTSAWLSRNHAPREYVCSSNSTSAAAAAASSSSHAAATATAIVVASSSPTTATAGAAAMAPKQTLPSSSTFLLDCAPTPDEVAAASTSNGAHDALYKGNTYMSGVDVAASATPATASLVATMPWTDVYTCAATASAAATAATDGSNGNGYHGSNHPHHYSNGNGNGNNTMTAFEVDNGVHDLRGSGHVGGGKRECVRWHTRIARGLARVLVRRLTPAQRERGDRLLSTLAATLAAVALIVANLIGFSARSASSSPGQAPTTVASGVTGANVTFVLCASVFLFCGCGVSCLCRRRDVVRQQQQRAFYGVSTTT